MRGRPRGRKESQGDGGVRHGRHHTPHGPGRRLQPWLAAPPSLPQRQAAPTAPRRATPQPPPSFRAAASPLQSPPMPLRRHQALAPPPKLPLLMRAVSPERKACDRTAWVTGRVAADLITAAGACGSARRKGSARLFHLSLQHCVKLLLLCKRRSGVVAAALGVGCGGLRLRRQMHGVTSSAQRARVERLAMRGEGAEGRRACLAAACESAADDVDAPGGGRGRSGVCTNNSKQAGAARQRVSQAAKLWRVVESISPEQR